jgi:hypothetical protein
MWERLPARQLNTRLEAALTDSLSIGNLDFSDKQICEFTIGFSL